MRAPGHGELGWVHRNRQAKLRAEVIGALVPRLLDPKLGEGVRHREAVRDCIGRFVDDAFRNLCTLGKVDGRSVEILVSHPTAAAAFHRQWLFQLVERLDCNCRFKVSPTVRFCFGVGGDPFALPHEGESD